MFEESKYGAYVFDGTWSEPQPADVIAYTAMQNTSAFHATAVYMNVSRDVCGPLALWEAIVRRDA